MPLPPCYSRRIALIDLSRQKVVVRPTPPKLATTWLGGKGWGAYWLLDHALSDPLDPKALCILATGPITGLPFPGAAKSGLFFRSPLTTFFGESYCGGYFGPLLKQSGFDALLITGRASHPVYILVEDQRVELCRAERLWGLTSWEAEAALHDEHGRRAAVAVIGPAGERLVRFACITHA
ncbi:aldehyde:ferredoxin oxidoreductase, partial [archaeon]|nr:aldehyde:ferredoxin oxidoreductase [archaeon]